jgi:hypothetical protein
MANSSTDYPEHFDAGLKPHRPRERYYFSRDPHPQRINRVVDISNYIDKKVESNLLNVTKGPGGNNGVKLREKLAKEGKRLPFLEGDDHAVNFNYVKRFVFGVDSISRSENISNKKIGEMYGLEWEERFHYISDLGNQHPNNLEKYIEENAKPK